MKKVVFSITVAFLFLTACSPKGDESKSDLSNSKVIEADSSDIASEKTESIESDFQRADDGSIDFYKMKAGTSFMGAKVAELTQLSDEFGIVLEGNIVLTGKLSIDREYDGALNLGLIREFQDVRNHFRVYDLTLNLFGRVTFKDDQKVLSRLSGEQVKMLNEGKTLDVTMAFNKLVTGGQMHSSYDSYGEFAKFVH